MTTRTYLPVLHTEVDGMGIVHHSNYPIWFEKGRRDYLKKAGVSSSKISSRGIYLPLSEIECKFRSPAKPGDEIIVFTKILSMSYVKVKFEYIAFEYRREKLLATGRTVHVWTNNKIEPINIVMAAPEIYGKLKLFSESHNNE